MGEGFTSKIAGMTLLRRCRIAGLERRYAVALAIGLVRVGRVSSHTDAGVNYWLK
jgi:hypothetical protein